MGGSGRSGGGNNKRAGTKEVQERGWNPPKIDKALGLFPKCLQTVLSVAMLRILPGER